MAAADLSIGAGGTVTWERCFLGLLSIIIAVADNQEKTCKYVQDLYAAIYVGKSSDVRVEHIEESICLLISNPEKVKKIEQVCLTLNEKFTRPFD